MPIADVEQRRFHSLRLNRLAVRELHLERLLVEGDRLVEVVDGNADVVYSIEHELDVNG